MVTSKVGMSKRTDFHDIFLYLRTHPNPFETLGSADKDFDELNRSFTAIEGSTDKILKDAAQFCDHVKGPYHKSPTA